MGAKIYTIYKKHFSACLKIFAVCCAAPKRKALGENNLNAQSK